MFYIHNGNATWIDVWGTLICSTLSLIGSSIIILSFITVKKQSAQSSPRSARMILNLALSDFVWFLAAFIQACFWFFTGPVGEVGVPPPGMCWVLGPTLNLSRIASLLWTSVIAFEALKSVTRRKWLSEKEKLLKYDTYYFIFVYGFALPSAIHLMYVQHINNDNVGCRAEYEHIGDMLSIFLTEFVPITFGFFLNVFSFYQVKRKMSSRAFPKSVRNRRRRVMMYYLGVCVLCWAPTMVHYAYALVFGTSRFLEVLARCLLYLTGLFNFFVFGINDPHLYRSFARFINYVSCGRCFTSVDLSSSLPAKQHKTVMFENADKLNADISKDKRTVYRYHRLSKEDKINLYTSRPDLDLKSKANNQSSPQKGGSGSGRGRVSKGGAELHEPLLDRKDSAYSHLSSSSRPVMTKRRVTPPPSPSRPKSSKSVDVEGRDDIESNAPAITSVLSASPEFREVVGLDEAILQNHDEEDRLLEQAEAADDRQSDSSRSSANSEEISIFEADDSSEEDEDESSQSHNVNELAASLG